MGCVRSNKRGGAGESSGPRPAPADAQREQPETWGGEGGAGGSPGGPTVNPPRPRGGRDAGSDEE